MKSYKQLEKDFNHKIKELQRKCKHEKSFALSGYWLKGYPKNKGLRQCKICQNIFIDKKEYKYEKTK